jgi:hypothetical protein
MGIPVLPPLELYSTKFNAKHKKAKNLPLETFCGFCLSGVILVFTGVPDFVTYFQESIEKSTFHFFIRHYI